MLNIAVRLADYLIESSRYLLNENFIKWDF